MSSVKFKNTRFNPEGTTFLSIAKQMANAFGYTAKLTVEDELAQLLRLRVAQKNECAYCVILHSKTAREIGIAVEKVDNISSWYNSKLFTAKEKTALTYCDALNGGIRVGFDKLHQSMAHYFTQEEITEIAAIIINMNVWTRLKLAQGETPFFE